MVFQLEWGLLVNTPAARTASAVLLQGFPHANCMWWAYIIEQLERVRRAWKKSLRRSFFTPGLRVPREAAWGSWHGWLQEVSLACLGSMYMYTCSFRVQRSSRCAMPDFESPFTALVQMNAPKARPQRTARSSIDRLGLHSDRGGLDGLISFCFGPGRSHRNRSINVWNSLQVKVS